MNKLTIAILYCMLILSIQDTYSQQEKEDSWGIHLSGFVKTDIFYDTRQTVSIREGHFLILPANESFDREGKDINAKSSFNILNIQTRFLGSIKGPDVLGAKTSGLIEAEFFGTSDADLNGLRLRHAFAKLDWANTSLMIGQYWHPMFVTDCAPHVVSFNTGAPFQPFTRNPQIRLTQKFGKISLALAALSQRDFTNSGPGKDATNKEIEIYSSIFLRNAIVPDLYLGIRYDIPNFLFGIAGEFKTLMPRTVTSMNVNTDETISSYSTMAYTKVIMDEFTIKTELVYGQNLNNMTMLGGYAVKSRDTSNGNETYTNMNIISLWAELSYGKDLEIALFLGYIKNLGFDENIIGPYYARGYNIDFMYRLSPRVQWSNGKLRFSLEGELTSASYGLNNNNDKGKVINSKIISNFRTLLACYLFF